jgi:hypothetical protein
MVIKQAINGGTLHKQPLVDGWYTELALFNSGLAMKISNRFEFVGNLGLIINYIWPFYEEYDWDDHEIEPSRCFP